MARQRSAWWRFSAGSCDCCYGRAFWNRLSGSGKGLWSQEKYQSAALPPWISQQALKIGLRQQDDRSWRWLRCVKETDHLASMTYRDFIKRGLDVTAASLGLVVAGPVIVVAATLVRLTSPGPAFFFQQRVGLGGESFTIYKLRTMHVNDARVLSQTRTDDPDVIAVGRILRRLKIDELPQILNVLKGDMSLIGPRPCMRQTYDEMEEWAKERFRVRPGLTGLAQVNGGVLLSWEQRSRLDVRYVRECSALLDFRILLKTVGVVLLGEERFVQAAN
jgi:undecaprenyl phosphate N,N'-diacetylbacillosamine 1-phosphate transferase